MRRWLLLGLLCLLGCQNMVGPFKPRPPWYVEGSGLTLEEQKTYARDRIAIPDESWLNGARGAVNRSR